MEEKVMPELTVKFSPRVLYGMSGKPEGDEVYCCKTCGALVAWPDANLHTDWHEKQAKRRSYARANS
jgi:hypothetical protein